MLGELPIDAVPVLAIDHARGDGINVDAMVNAIQPGRVHQANERRLRRALEAYQGVHEAEIPGRR